MDRKNWYVYIIQTESSTLYTGITTDVSRRFGEHLDIFNGVRTAKGAKYFRRSKPVAVVHQEIFDNRSDASKREAAIKRMTKAKKSALIKQRNQMKLKQLSPHVYWLESDHTTDRPVLGAIVGQRATLIVDSGNSEAHANLFLDQIAGYEINPSHWYVVLTHWHWDHVFGSHMFERPDSTLTLIAHNETRQLVAEMAEQDWSDEALEQRVKDGTEIEFCRDMIKAELPDRSDLRIKVPDLSFATQLELDLGGVRCVVKHVGGDHAADSSIVYVPEERVLFLSDCLYEDLHHGPRYYTTKKLLPLLDEIERYEADYYMWGHDPEPMSREKFVEFTALARKIGKQVDQIGNNRELLLQNLVDELGAPLDEEGIELVDSFLAGL